MSQSEASSVVSASTLSRITPPFSAIPSFSPHTPTSFPVWSQALSRSLEPSCASSWDGTEALVTEPSSFPSRRLLRKVRPTRLMVRLHHAQDAPLCPRESAVISTCLFSTSRLCLETLHPMPCAIRGLLPTVQRLTLMPALPPAMAEPRQGRVPAWVVPAMAMMLAVLLLGHGPAGSPWTQCAEARQLQTKPNSLLTLRPSSRYLISPP